MTLPTFKSFFPITYRTAFFATVVGFTIVSFLGIYFIHKEIIPVFDTSSDPVLGANFQLSTLSTGTSTLPGVLNVEQANSTSTFAGNLVAKSLTAQYIIATSTSATSTFAGNVGITGNLQVSGNFFAPATIVSSGNATINGDLTVTGNFDGTTGDFSSTLTMSGSATDTRIITSNPTVTHTGTRQVYALTPTVTLDASAGAQDNFRLLPSYIPTQNFAGQVTNLNNNTQVGTAAANSFNLTSAVGVQGQTLRLNTGGGYTGAISNFRAINIADINNGG